MARVVQPIEQVLDSSLAQVQAEVLGGHVFQRVRLIEDHDLVIRKEAASLPAYSVIRVTYVKLLTSGGPVYGFVTRARWVNIDTPAALEAADLTLRSAPFRF